MKHYLLCFLFLILLNLFYYAPNTIASPIINGIPDDHHQFKFHVSIYKKEYPSTVFKHACGGSIISERYILTAAHCFITKVNNIVTDIFYPRGRTKIKAGTNDMNGPAIERDLIRIFIPLEYNKDPSYRPGRIPVHADIAVAELSADLVVHQRPDRLAIMPLEALDPHSNAGVNERAKFCGFGPDKLEQRSDELVFPARSDNTINKFMNVMILGRDKCTEFDTAFCVMNSDRVFRTSCFGDSGAGLVYNNKLIGVLSVGPSFCDTSDPIIFTRLYRYMRFIEEAQKPLGDRRFMTILDQDIKAALEGFINPKPSRPHYGSSSSSAGRKKKLF